MLAVVASPTSENPGRPRLLLVPENLLQIDVSDLGWQEVYLDLFRGVKRPR